MAKVHSFSTAWAVTAGVLALTMEVRNAGDSKDALPLSKITRSVDLNIVFPGYAALNELGQTAIEFGAFTRLRNSTGSAETADEATEAIDRILASWEAGDWGAEREQATTPFTATHILSLAVAKATNGQQPAAEAAAKLCELTEATCKANGSKPFAELAPEDRAKMRRAIIAHVKSKKPAIAAALSALEGERAAAAAKRKMDAAAAAAAAAAKAMADGAGSDDTGLAGL